MDASRLFFRTVADGMADNIVNVMYQDRRGFVWLGTQTGLNRFDGVDVVTFPQFSGYTVRTIAETDSLTLWVGTDKGLLKFDRRSETIEPVALDARQNVEVGALFSTGKGKLMVGTTRGLFVYGDKTFRQVLFEGEAFSSTNNITAMARTGEDTFWLASHNGLIEYHPADDSSTVYVNEQNGVNDFFCLAQAGNKLYVGTYGAGLVLFDLDKKEFSIHPQFSGDYIKALLLTDDNTLLVGTNGNGVKGIDTATGEISFSIEHTGKRGGICSNAVYSLLQDGDVLFVGTYMGGFCYTPRRGDLFSVYALPGLFNSEGLNVRAFYIAPNGEKVLGTRDGFYYISEEKKTVKHYSQQNSILRSDIILAVMPLERDYLIGTFSGGLYLFHPDSGALCFFLPDECFKHESFSCFEKDNAGNIWMGSSTAVYVYNVASRTYKTFNSRNSTLSSNTIFWLKADSKNRIWVGTGKGVFMYDAATSTFTSDIFPETIAAYTKSIRYIYEDRDKDLWFCDDKEGVVKADEGFTRFDHFTIDNILPNNSVMSIVEDPVDGGLWFATQWGLLYSKERRHKLFYLYDGIPGYIFNHPVQITGDNTVWWGNEQGLVYYNASLKAARAHHTGASAYPPVITAIDVAGKRLSAGDALMPWSPAFMDNISLPETDGNISFTFSALNYAEEDADPYEYFLEGHDKEWKTLMKGNQASYTALPIGKYTFHVRPVSNPENVKSLTVTVVRANAFTGALVTSIVIILVICLLFLYMVARYREKKKTETVEAKTAKYQKSKMEEETATRIISKLTHCMQQEKLYLDADLKLQDVAAAIGCNTVELSQVLNTFMQTNFTDYVNKYRIEEFIRRAQDKSASKYTLTSLSEQCGFSSRTSFFRSFKKLMEVSPAEYLKGKLPMQ